jgi:hypothetical protein
MIPGTDVRVGEKTKSAERHGIRRRRAAAIKDKKSASSNVNVILKYP